MLLTEEHMHASVPQSRAERQRYIAAQEKAWLSLSWDRKRFTTEAAKSALTLLSAIAFSDHRDPIDLSLLSEDGMSSGASSSRGTKRPASAMSPDADDAQPPPSRRASASGSPARGAHNSSSGGANNNNNGNAAHGNGNAGSSSNHNGNKNSSNADRSQQQQQQQQQSNGGSGSAKESAPNASKKSSKPKRLKTSNIIPEGTQVACYDRTVHNNWVLGRVSRYLPEQKKYEVLDDADGEEYKYRVFKRNIRVIPKRAQTFDPKKRVLAVYPMTTVFYPAALVSRKGKMWTVEFEDEDDPESSKFKEVDARFIIQE